MDLVVVGGGPVGLVAALHAARLGMSAVVVEPRLSPVDKACGEGIMPAGVAELAALGVHPDGHPIRGIRYVDGSALDGRGPSADAPVGPQPGLGVRRTTLHAALTRATEAAGDGIRQVQDRVVDLAQDDGGVTVGLAGGGEVRAGHVVAADGLLSPTRRLLGLDRPSRAPRRRGLRRHYRVAPWTDHVEVHWGRSCEAYVTPVADDVVGVAVLTACVGGFSEQLVEMPWLASRLEAAAPLDEVRGAGPLRQRAAHRVAGRVLLAGDAAGYVDALTGEGLTLGWRQARAAVECVAVGDARGYEARWHAIGMPARALTSSLVVATRSTVVRRHLVTAAARVPWAYRSAVRVVASSG
ncbi:NAD(P)/FAD-dependent oxidoreductase [Arsenicicoccus cauae]|uniref:NAD(P)/FAD-dependent oxidoreductase n=1 Tax=Arsenicicoccus cauae TaxID=2663847 RepID=UPI00370DD30D